MKRLIDIEKLLNLVDSEILEMRDLEVWVDDQVLIKAFMRNNFGDDCGTAVFEQEPEVSLKLPSLSASVPASVLKTTIQNAAKVLRCKTGVIREGNVDGIKVIKEKKGKHLLCEVDLTHPNLSNPEFRLKAEHFHNAKTMFYDSKAAFQVFGRPSGTDGKWIPRDYEWLKRKFDDNEIVSAGRHHRYPIGLTVQKASEEYNKK